MEKATSVESEIVFIDKFLVFIWASVLFGFLILFDEYGIPFVGIISTVVCLIVGWHRFAKKQDRVWKKILTMFGALIASLFLGLVGIFFLPIIPFLAWRFFLGTVNRHEYGKGVKVLVISALFLLPIGGFLPFIHIFFFFLDRFFPHGVIVFLLSNRPYIWAVLLFVTMILGSLLYLEKDDLVSDEEDI